MSFLDDSMGNVRWNASNKGDREVMLKSPLSDRLNARQRIIVLLSVIIINAGNVLLPVCAAADAAAKTDKFTDPEKILAAFEAGRETTEIIINLSDDPQWQQRTRWNDPQSRQALRQNIHSRQQRFLESLGSDPFLLRHRLKNQLTLSAHVTPAVLKKLSEHPMVESIEPVIYFEPHLSQGISLMNAANARMTHSGAGVSVAICDTGIDYTHPMLGAGGFPNSKVIGGYDLGDNDANPIPDGGAHGTACAGIAAGDIGSTGDYIGGVAYNAKLYALKITAGSDGSATNVTIAAAWDWCVTHQYDDPANPIMVISTSFGGGRYYGDCDGSPFPSSLKIAAQNAVAAGITVLASSGNDGFCDSISSPACVSDVLSVGAVYDASFGTYSPCINADSCASKTATSGCSSGYYASDVTAADAVTSYSNTASFLDILAPSNQAYTTDISGASGYSASDYTPSFGGTSAACPYAAGAVACLQSAARDVTGAFLTPQEVRSILVSSGDAVTDGKVAITKPRVNLGGAVTELATTPPTASDVSASAERDVSTVIQLDAVDDGAPAALRYVITSLPNHGTLTDPAAGVITAVPYGLPDGGDEVIYTSGLNCAASANFTYKANDGGTAPDGGDSNEALVRITVSSLRVLYEADMDTDPNWTFDAGSDWQWGTPAGSGGDPTSGVTGANVIGYNLAGQYPPNITSTHWATTPAMDCSGQTDVQLQFYRWLGIGRPNKDHAYIEVSNDGLNWTREWENPDVITDSSWMLQTIDISTVADNQPTVYLRWGLGTTDNNRHYAGWNIDDVIVTGLSGAFVPLSGDFEPDCDVDADDLSRLIAYWLQTCGNCQGADLIADGIVNLKDFRVLAQNWLETN